MCIQGPVGRGSHNDIIDVMVVQNLLNMNLGRYAGVQPPAQLQPDGRIGLKTIDAIQQFETRIMGLPESDGIIVPGDATLKALIAGLPPGYVEEKLAIVMPQATASRIDLYYQPLLAGMPKYGITSELQIAHFLAQLAHESGSFLYPEELASGEAYEGRNDLGNTQPGDGRRFKGRGLIQLTGRANYTRYSQASGQDFVSHPERIANEPLLAVDVACWFWADKRIGPMADRDDVKAVTKAINGQADGPNTHLKSRLEFLFRAKSLIGI
nr:glycoside hydrolase family 19 protein [uncultured Roseateles sp.]